jgi:CRP-like cAMP-binding protein
MTTTAESFLGRLDSPDRAAIAERWSEKRYRRGETIIAHDEESRDVFFVLEGIARATVYSEAGRTVAYRDIETGHIFGELAAIDRRKRSASVMALGPIVVARLSDAAFRELVDTRPSFRWALLSHLSAQVRRLSDRVYEFSTLVVRKRLIRELLRLAEPSEPNHARVDPAPKHLDLAAKISTHREAVSREMSALAKRKLTEKRGRALLLLDVAALTELSEEEE